MAKTMTILDFIEEIKDKVPSNMFTDYSIYAEVDPNFMIEFDDASPVELAQTYGASLEEISEPPSKKISYDDYGEFNEIDIQGDVDNSLAYEWLNKKFKEGKLNSFWPIVNFMFTDNLVIVEPNGMIDNGRLAYDGMTLHEFMKALSQFLEDEDPSKCQIALPNKNGYLTYNDAIIDTVSHQVILKFK